MLQESIFLLSRYIYIDRDVDIDINKLYFNTVETSKERLKDNNKSKILLHVFVLWVPIDDYKSLFPS